MPNITFDPALFSLSGSIPKGVAAGDFNKDGYMDLAIVNENVGKA